MSPFVPACPGRGENRQPPFSMLHDERQMTSGQKSDFPLGFASTRSLLRKCHAEPAAAAKHLGWGVASASSDPSSFPAKDSRRRGSVQYRRPRRPHAMGHERFRVKVRGDIFQGTFEPRPPPFVKGSWGDFSGVKGFSGPSMRERPGVPRHYTGPRSSDTRLNWTPVGGSNSTTVTAPRGFFREGPNGVPE